MQLLPGAITLIQLQKREASARNLGPIAVIGTLTLVVEVDCGEVEVGDLVLVSMSVEGVKGGLSGFTIFNCQKTSGTAIVSFVDNEDSVSESKYIDAFLTHYWTFTTIVRITGAGPLTLGVKGYSLGSTTTVNISHGQMYCWIYRGST